MIIVHLTGGLGNQLFQYATGKALAIHANQKLLFDISSYSWDNLRNYELSVFNFNYEIAKNQDLERINNSSPFFLDRLFYKILFKPIPYFRLPLIKEQSFKYDSNFFNFRKKDVIIKGYWQSEKYFKNIRHLILKDLLLDESNYTKKWSFYKELIDSSDSSVSIHIRRGDYVSNSSTNSYHGLCDIDYYNSALLNIQKRIKNPTYFIFSDDKNYARDLFAHKSNTVIVEDIVFDYEEIILMSKCDHNIIANSSFSWWGAWLNEKDTSTVIAPKKWFNDLKMQQQTKDLLPESWIKI